MNQKLPESLWREIRHEYQTSKTTCRDLALKYGINRETVASRCKLEKWRCRRMEGETQRRETFSHLGCEPQVVPVPQQFTHRIMGEAAVPRRDNREESGVFDFTIIAGELGRGTAGV
jgi:hypothetical protein